MIWSICSLLILLNVCFVSTQTFRCGPQNECKCKFVYETVTEIDCTNSTINISDICDFVSHSNITRLKFLQSNFTTLQSTDFVGCDNLTYINLQNGSISKMGDGAFRHLQRLQEMDLSRNNLQIIYNKSVPCRFEHLKGLKALYINGNIKKDLENGAFPNISCLPSISTLHLDCVSYSLFGPEFASLQQLQNVSISGFNGFCNIGRVSNSSFEGLTYVKNLCISHCNMTGFDAGALLHLPQLERLDLSYNQRVGFAILPNVSYGLQFTNIKVLNASKMFPTFGIGKTLKKRHVCYLFNTSIEELDFSSNKIALLETNGLILMPDTLVKSYLNDNAFTFGPYLMQMSCPNNITEVYANKEFSNHSPFEYNKEPISVLDLDHSDGADCPFMQDSYLRNISIERNCKFFENDHNISLTDITIPSQLKRAEYSNCHLEYEVPRLPVLTTNIVEYADFSGNLLDAWIGPVGLFTELKYLDLSNNYCSYISGNFFEYMKNLINLQIHDNLLGLSNFQVNPFNSLTVLRTLNMSSNRIESVPTRIFASLFSIETIDLSRNILQNIDFEYETLANLSSLNVSHNAIRRIPTRLLHHLYEVSKRRGFPFTIDLTGNVLMFSCNDQKFLDKLLAYRNNCVNFNNYIFEKDDGTQFRGSSLDKRLKVLHKECSPYTIIIAGCSIGIVLFFTIVVGGLVHKHRWKLRFLMHMAKRRYFGYEPVIHDDDVDVDEKTYDAFISYAEEDVRFIRNGIIPQVEDNGFKLCIHQRDFLAGKPVADNIVDAIKASRKTITVLSEKYVRKRWCMYEFQMARMESLYYRNNSLLVIMLEPVSVDEMPLEMIEWIDTESYLEYTTDVDGNALFWDRLRAYLHDTN